MSNTKPTRPHCGVFRGLSGDQLTNTAQVEDSMNSCNVTTAKRGCHILMVVLYGYEILKRKGIGGIVSRERRSMN